MTQPRRRRPHPEWRRIRELFLRPRDTYSIGELPQLLGLGPEAIHQAIADRTVSAIHSADDDVRVPWHDAVTLALDHRWTYRMLTEALRGVHSSALPPLVRTRTGRITLPRYQWQLLRLLAAQRSRDERREITPSDLLEEAITTALITRIGEWDEIEKALPGTHAASAWPSGE